MAERRMFAKTIIDSDAFLDMPLSSQSLYFHLSMRGDDEGFVNNPKKIQRMIGASEDDLKLLIAKGFIIAFETGVIVIKHWKIHNYIRGDRLQPTVYVEERSALEIKENGTYTFVSQMSDTCQSVDGQVSAQVSIGKVSIDKDNNMSSVTDDFEYLWSIYPRKEGKKTALEAYKMAVKKGVSKETVETGILAYINKLNAECTERQYIKKGDTFFRGEHWDDDYSITGVSNGRFNKYGGISAGNTNDNRLDDTFI